MLHLYQPRSLICFSRPSISLFFSWIAFCCRRRLSLSDFLVVKDSWMRDFLHSSSRYCSASTSSSREDSTLQCSYLSSSQSKWFCRVYSMNYSLHLSRSSQSYDYISWNVLCSTRSYSFLLISWIIYSSAQISPTVASINYFLSPSLKLRPLISFISSFLFSTCLRKPSCLALIFYLMARALSCSCFMYVSLTSEVFLSISCFFSLARSRLIWDSTCLRSYIKKRVHQGRTPGRVRQFPLLSSSSIWIIVIIPKK